MSSVNDEWIVLMTDEWIVFMPNNQSLSALINEHKGISPEMASRLAEVFGSTAETWLGMQMA